MDRAHWMENTHIYCSYSGILLWNGEAQMKASITPELDLTQSVHVYA